MFPKITAITVTTARIITLTTKTYLYPCFKSTLQISKVLWILPLCGSESSEQLAIEQILFRMAGFAD